MAFARVVIGQCKMSKQLIFNNIFILQNLVDEYSIRNSLSVKFRPNWWSAVPGTEDTANILALKNITYIIRRYISRGAKMCLNMWP